jgi:hypothetical protein
MPFAYPNQPRLKLDVLDRIDAGEQLMTICADPAMPSYGSVYAWARADPAFATALADARRRADHIRRLSFDEGKARAIVARVAAGEKLVSVLRDPGMPSRLVCAHWRATQAHFAEELWRLHGLRRQEGARRMKARLRPFDQDLADRIMIRVARGEALERVLTSDPALPGRPVHTRWRRERPDYDRLVRLAIGMGQRRQGGARRRLTPELTEAILGGIVEGESLASLGRRPDMPCAGTLYGWVARDREFAGEVAQACDHREDWYEDQFLMLMDAAGPATIEALRQRMAPLRGRHARLQNRPGRKSRGSLE